MRRPTSVMVIAVVIASILAGCGSDTHHRLTTSISSSSSIGEVLATIQVQGGRPVGGVTHLVVTNGERIRLIVTSADTSDVIDVRGYGVTKRLQAPGTARLAFVAHADGTYAIELEGSRQRIAELEVKPG